jgi:hypothetical protein
MDNPPTVLPGCDTCSVIIDSSGEPHHRPDCLRQKHNRLKDAVVKVLKELGDSLGDAIGNAKFGGE